MAFNFMSRSTVSMYFFISYARTEYHCKNCGGHHGQNFDDIKSKDIVIMDYA